MMMSIYRKLDSTTRCVTSLLRIEYAKRNFSKVKIDLTKSREISELLKNDIRFVKRHSGLKKIFPNGMKVLNDMASEIHTYFDSNFRIKVKTDTVGVADDNQVVIKATLRFNWPTPLVFEGYGFSNYTAKDHASIRALQYLFRGKHIRKDGNPVIKSNQEEVRKMRYEWTRIPEITLPPHLLQEGSNLVDQVEKECQNYLEQRSSGVFSSLPGPKKGDIFHYDGYEEDFGEKYRTPVIDTPREKYHMLIGNSYTIDHSPWINKKLKRDLLLLREEKEIKERSFPMYNYKDVLEEALANHQVVIISGETGCGKSTLVPQMIFDKWIMEGKGADCNIVISQPRRISVTSLAEYVCSNRKVTLGDTVGFHVRFKYKPIKHPGGILFMTSGMLLNNLVYYNPSLEGVSHVIIDEVHSRDLSTDLLILYLRHLISKNSNIKLILMSASVNTDELMEYFEESKPSLIKVPGSLYPLKHYYIEDLWKEFNMSQMKYSIAHLMRLSGKTTIDKTLVFDVIKAIDSFRPPGAILCFLSGWEEIKILKEMLEKDKELNNRLLVVPFHSRLLHSEQMKVFQTPSPNLRKVVLATNIAETSLTVKDVVYVIDTGFHKENRFVGEGKNSLSDYWISKSNVLQRAGRAARVQPGEVFHLYSNEVHQDMMENCIPEIMRVSLDFVILQSKIHFGKTSTPSFLSDALSSPYVDAIENALDFLEEKGMLKVDHETSEETLTTLGKRAVKMPIPSVFSKALLYSSIFKCVDPVLSVVCHNSCNSHIFKFDPISTDDIRRVKILKDVNSDLVALIKIFKDWEESPFKFEYEEENSDIDFSHLVSWQDVKGLFVHHLQSSSMIDDYDDSKWNINQQNVQLILGIFLAALDFNHLLLLRRGKFKNGILKDHIPVIKTLKGDEIRPLKSSVLKELDKDVDKEAFHTLSLELTEKYKSLGFARDLSLIRPLTVVLFGGKSVKLKEAENGFVLNIDNVKQLSFLVDHSTGQFLEKLREAMSNMIEILLETRGLEYLSPQLESLFDDLVQYVSKLLECPKNNDFEEK